MDDGWRPALVRCVFALVLALLSAPAMAACIKLPTEGADKFTCVGPKCAPAVYPQAGRKPTWAALVFGNNVYRGNHSDIVDLKNAEVDAEKIAASLEEQGFSVRCVLNASAEQADIEIRALATFMKGLHLQQLSPEASRIFVYFAGHGTNVDGDNYVLFSDDYDSRLTKEDFVAKARRVDDILGPMKNYARVHPFLVIDACRSQISLGPSGVRGKTHETSKTDQLPGFPGYYVVYSTSQGQAAADDDERFMRYFAGEFESWGRSFGSMVTITQTLLERSSKSKQTLRPVPKTQLADLKWRHSDDEECDGAQHNLAESALFKCIDRPTAECFSQFAPTPWQCVQWQSSVAFFQSSVLPKGSACLNRLKSYFRNMFDARCRAVATAQAPLLIQDGHRQVQLASLQAADVKQQLASDRLGFSVKQATVQTMSRTESMSWTGGDRAEDLDRRTEWNDLLAVPKPGAKVAMVANGTRGVTGPRDSGGGGRGEPAVMTRTVAPREVIELACDTAECNAQNVKVKIYDPASTRSTRSATVSLPVEAEIKRTDLAPRTADEVLTFEFAETSVLPSEADQARLMEMARKYFEMPGARIRVTGGFRRPGGAARDDRVAYQRSITRATSRSLKVGELLTRLSKSTAFKPETDLSAGEVTLVDLANNRSEPVFVEFYKPN